MSTWQSITAALSPSACNWCKQENPPPCLMSTELTHDYPVLGLPASRGEPGQAQGCPHSRLSRGSSRESSPKARAGLGQEEHGHNPTESQDESAGHGPRCSARDALPRLTLGVIRLQLLRAELANSLIPALQRQLSPRATKRPRQPAHKQTRRCAEGSEPECSSPRQGALLGTWHSAGMWAGRHGWGAPGLRTDTRPAGHGAAHGDGGPASLHGKGWAVLLCLPHTSYKWASVLTTAAGQGCFLDLQVLNE